MLVVSNTSPLSNLVLGVLRHAKQTGRVPSLKHEVQRLRAEARFFINPALEKALLISVGEL